MTKQVRRCGWCGDDPLYTDYHDNEWGSPLYDDRKLFEFLLLEGAQAGLAWITVLRKRENFREAYDDFDPEIIAGYGKRKINQLMNNAGIIRNRLKIASAINNAQRYLELVERGDTLSGFLWQFVDHKPTQNRFLDMADVPATSPASDAMAKALKKAGFNFVGSTICYALMQATGMVNDHVTGCFRHKECAAAAQ